MEISVSDNFRFGRIRNYFLRRSPELGDASTEAGIARIAGPCGGYAIEKGRIAFDTAEGRKTFDTVYPALGSDSNNALPLPVLWR